MNSLQEFPAAVTATATPTKRGETVRRELRLLSVTVKENIFEMLRMASQVLNDRDYCDRFGGYDKLLDSLEKEEFSHFGGTPTLTSMLRAYEANPDAAEWKKYQFNIHAMVLLAKPRKQERDYFPRVDWKTKAKLQEAELLSTKQRLEQAESERKAAAATPTPPPIQAQQRQLQAPVSAPCPSEPSPAPVRRLSLPANISAAQAIEQRDRLIEELERRVQELTSENSDLKAKLAEYQNRSAA